MMEFIKNKLLKVHILKGGFLSITQMNMLRPCIRKQLHFLCLFLFSIKAPHCEASFLHHCDETVLHHVVI